MTISKIEEISKYRSKIYIDDRFAFILYPQDIRKYKIAVDVDITEDTYNSIINEIVLRRCKNRAINYIESRERTEYEIRNKLKTLYYTEEVIDRVIAFLEEYHYIDDERYAKQFVDTYANRKSKARLRQDLMLKGVDKEIIQYTLEETEVDEEAVLRELVDRKLFHIDKLDDNMYRRTVNFFMRRGYNYQLISKFLLQSNKISQK